MSNDVTNLRDTILAKSDQLNADDIVGGSITITVSTIHNSITFLPARFDHTVHNVTRVCRVQN